MINMSDLQKLMNLTFSRDFALENSFSAYSWNESIDSFVFANCIASYTVSKDKNSYLIINEYGIWRSSENLHFTKLYLALASDQEAMIYLVL